MKSLLHRANAPDRRQFLSTAAKTFLGVSAAPMLGSTAAAAGKDASALRQVPTARRVIYLYMNGGMSHLDTWDPKPGQDDVMGPTRTIGTNVDGIRIGEYLPRMAKQMKHCAVVRSLSSTQGAHKQGNYYVHTSYTLRSSIRHPAMGAWLMNFEGKGNEALPGNIMIGGDSQHPGSGFLESRLSPLMISDPSAGLQNSQLSDKVTRERFDRALSVSAQLDRGFLERYDQKPIRAYTDMYDDAVKLMDSGDLAAFDISKEPEGLRERYGDNSFGQGCLLARRLAEAGVRYTEVSLGGWDTHNGNFINVPDKAEILDTAMAALLADLERRGMLHDTLVVLASEFGRTPEINQNDGRDHHPQAFSAVLAGGGIRGGQVFGETDETATNVVSNKVSPPDINATIGYALGLPLNQVVFSPSKRPFTVADKGKPIVSLFG